MKEAALARVWLFRQTKIISRMRWVGHVERLGQNRNAYSVLAAKRKISFEITRRIWDDIKMDLKETGYGLVEWICLGQGGDYQ